MKKAPVIGRWALVRLGNSGCQTRLPDLGQRGNGATEVMWSQMTLDNSLLGGLRHRSLPERIPSSEMEWHSATIRHHHRCMRAPEHEPKYSVFADFLQQASCLALPVDPYLHE